jgi:hypothetical protein
VVLLATLAVVVPVSAFALEGTAGSLGTLSVGASLGGCDTGSSPPRCSINVTFTGLPGTAYYTAAVAKPDGSVQGFGQVASGEGGGSAVLSVPYGGRGTYSVNVFAYGAAGAAAPSAGAAASLR